jgi:hypothetical protein
MYDPFVVDTFLKFIDHIVPVDTSEHVEISNDQYDRKSYWSHSDTEQSKATLLERRDTTIASSFLKAAIDISDDLKRNIPDAAYIIFKYDLRAKVLIPIHWSECLSVDIQTLRIPFAQQLSGWVAANRETIANSDPWLDLLELSHELGLRHALCTPIASGTVLFGVLSLYRKSDTLFSHDDTFYAESLGRAISTTLASRIAHSGDFVWRRR